MQGVTFVCSASPFTRLRIAAAFTAPSSRDIPRRSPGSAIRFGQPSSAHMSIPVLVAASILSCSSLRIRPSWNEVPVPVISVGARPYFLRIGTCCAVGRSTPLNPSLASTWQRSSNESFDWPQTEAMTLCLSGTRLGAAAAAGGACPAGEALSDAAASGAAAMPARKSRLFMRAIYFAHRMPSQFSSIGFTVSSGEDLAALASQVTDKADRIVTAAGEYLRWAPHSGLERPGEQLWLQITSKGDAMGMNPHFAGKSSVRVAVEARVARPAQTPLDGAFLAWANPPAGAATGGDYPFAFDCPDAARHLDLALPTVVTAQVAAFA